MKTKILLILIALLLLSATASASGSTRASFNSVIPATKMTGGRYVLVDQSQQVNGALTGSSNDQAQPVNGMLTGGRYRLAKPNQPTAATGCCCKGFLPCVRK